MGVAYTVYTTLDQQLSPPGVMHGTYIYLICGI